MQFCIQLRQRVLIVDRCFSYVPDSCSFDNVSNDEFLDRFVFRNTSGTISTADVFNVSPAMFRSAIVSSFLRLSEDTVSHLLIYTTIIKTYHSEECVS